MEYVNVRHDELVSTLLIASQSTNVSFSPSPGKSKYSFVQLSTITKLFFVLNLISFHLNLNDFSNREIGSRASVYPPS